MSAWGGYVDAVLRPMREADERIEAEREVVARTLRIAADRLEREKPADPIAWLRQEADTLTTAQ